MAAQRAVLRAAFKSPALEGRDTTQQFSKPLTKDRLFDWHAALFPTGRSGMRKITVGDWRTVDAGPMQVVSGPIGKEKIHFEAQARIV